MRGGGNPIGQQQSGIPKFRIANLDFDKELLTMLIKTQMK